MASFFETITAAVNDFARNGYDSERRLEEWVARIRSAAEAELISEAQLQEQLRASLNTIYQRLVENGALLKQHPGVSRFTLQNVKPELRAELQRRILASADLIKLNRERAINGTLQRFQGWATSIPPGGSRAVDRREVKSLTRSEMQKMGFLARRVAIDQGHKFMSNLSQIVAQDGGAIAAIWHQHHTRYPRKTHTERDGKVYLVRGSWAHKGGLVKPGPAGYTDQITMPGEEVYCRCTYQYIYRLRAVPSEMLTRFGAQELARVQKELAAVA